MKKTFAIFSTLMLCILLLLVTVGTTMATEPGYEIAEPYEVGDVNLNGAWDSGEWDESWIEYNFNGSNALYAYKMVLPMMSWLVEFNDTTTDAEDVWMICIDGAADGGTVPNAQDHKIEIVGHTTLTVYEGDGEGWVVQTGATVDWIDSLTTTPENPSTHYVLEIQIDKGTLGAWGANPPPHGLLVGMYDASNTSQGWLMWPPTSPDNPERYGIISTYNPTIPEVFSVGVVVLLSAVAVAVSFYLLRKRPKTES